MNGENSHGDSQAATNALAVLLGGITVDIIYRDASQAQVRVRELRVKDFEKLLPSIDDEETTAELYCEQPAGWAATLTTESLGKVIEEGEKLNLAPFEKWLSRRSERTKKVRRALGLDTTKTAVE